MLQGTLFPPESDWRPPRLGELPQDWNAFSRMAVDTETCDPLLKKLGPGVRRGGYITGVSVAFEGGPAHYIPLRHLGGDNVEDHRLALGYLRRQAKAFRGEVVGAKLSYDLDYLAQVGVEFKALKAFLDVQVAEPLLDELQYSYSLNAILGRHGLPLKDEELLRSAASSYGIDPKSEMWKMPARFVGRYAEADVTLPLQLMRKQEEQLRAQGLERVWALECAVLPILVKMRRRGVRVSEDRLDGVERFSRAEEAKAWGELARVTGVTVRVGDAMKPEPIARALEAVGVRVGKTARGAPSITKEMLEGLDHPAGKLIRRGRKMSQLRTTFIASVREHLVNGRVHTTFNQIRMESDEDKGGQEGVAGGRLSSVDPNLQQQPARDPEIGPLWRSIYLPDAGAEWVSADFSQQEPRLAVHFAVATPASKYEEVLKSSQRAHRARESALEAARRYREDPNADSHTMFTAMVHGDQVYEWDRAGRDESLPKEERDAAKKRLKLLRDPAKNIYLGVCYGMGGPKLCRSLGYSTKIMLNERTGRRVEVAGDEGQALLDLVDARVPYVRATARAVEAVAKARGYVVTISGRRCRFPVDEAGNFDWTHKGFNRVIQNSAADQTKEAMVALDREGYPLQLQIHDEFTHSSSDRSDDERVAAIMRDCVQLHVPSKVDVERGPSWGEAR